MPDANLLKLAGLQEEVKEQRMTEQEVKLKLDLFENLFSKGCYLCSRFIADELYNARLGNAPGYAMVCARAYGPYHRVLREKGEDECIRINILFMRYHFGNWMLAENRRKREINKFKNTAG